MTALTQYERLESIGLWRDDPEAQRREVLVRFGEATLVLSDPRSEIPLSHWSLPAVERRNPGVLPALYAPGADALETLELDDADMIVALEKVRGAVAAAIPRPGRLRGAVLGGLMLTVVALGVFWVPDALITHTASVVPASQRAEFGQMALDDVVRLTGAPCDNQQGLRALAALSERVFGPLDTPILYVVRDGVPLGLHLPGDVIVLSNKLISTANGPEALAGAALAEGQRRTLQDPMIPLLTHAGLRATFRLLTTGELSPAAVQGYGETILRATPAPLADEPLLAAFKDARIPSSAYGYALDPTGESSLTLIEADPFRGLSPTPLIPDGDWVALQGLCSG
ncbi:MAG: hypothetical protein V4712_14665 [Pseudomonadota bacterium]